ncbi:MAG: amidohydrolase family protein, partial [Bacteroidota bacterium]
MKRISLLVVFFLTVSAICQTKKEVTAIKCGRLIDGKSESVATDVIVLVEGNIIKEVGMGIAIPSGAKVIDLSNATV